MGKGKRLRDSQVTAGASTSTSVGAATHTGDDVWLRCSFLHQAAHLLTLASPPCDEGHTADRRPLLLSPVATHLAHTLRCVCSKTVRRLSPHIKRNLCRRCCAVLLPGVTCHIRSRGRRNPAVLQRCVQCGHSRRIVCVKDPYSGVWLSNIPEEEEQEQEEEQEEGPKDAGEVQEKSEQPS